MSIQKFPDGKLIIETTIPDYDFLLMYLGVAVEHLRTSGHRNMAKAVISLLNRINMGNPEWQPYNLEHYERNLKVKYPSLFGNESNKTD
jgi:hypothetical protein